MTFFEFKISTAGGAPGFASESAVLRPDAKQRWAGIDAMRALQNRVPRCPLGFALFVLLNGVLFIRPAELFPEFNQVPIFEWVILACLAASFPVVLAQLSLHSLRRNPITVCVLCLVPAIILSHVSNGDLYDARIHAADFLKVVIYYLLLVGLINNPRRLRLFLLIFVVFVLCTATLSLLNHQGIISVPALADVQQAYGEDDTGETNYIFRLSALGIFNDPNDFCLILNAALFICLHWMFQQRNSLVKILWLLPIGWLGYALFLTQSRGGLLSLLAGLLVFLFMRVGWRKAVLLSAVLLPTILMTLGGRITDINIADAEDTAQGRVQIWRDCLVLFHHVPFFGSGYGTLADEIDYVAHNSYIHCYAELGFFGGTLFMGMFYLAATGLRQLRPKKNPDLPPDLRSLRLCLFPVFVAYAVGLYSLSRPYYEATYMIIGVASTLLAFNGGIGFREREFSGRLLKRMSFLSFVVLVYFEIFVRAFAV